MGKWKKVVILVQIDICWYFNRPIANTMQVVQLDEHPGIEEKLCRYKSKGEKQDSQCCCSLWDISVEEDVSAFYLEFGALDIFVELFSNPNHRFQIFCDCSPLLCDTVSWTVSTGWKRLQLESWQTCSAMRKSFWESWKSRGNMTSSHMLCLLLFQSVQLQNLRYLEKLLRLLDVKDSPTLSLVFRCKLALALQFCHKTFVYMPSQL